jgi:transposase-like protein
MPTCPNCGSSNTDLEMVFLVVMQGFQCKKCGHKFARPFWKD